MRDLQQPEPEVMRTMKMTTIEMDSDKRTTRDDDNDSDAGCGGQDKLRQVFRQATATKNKRDGGSASTFHTTTIAYLAVSLSSDEWCEEVKHEVPERFHNIARLLRKHG